MEIISNAQQPAVQATAQATTTTVNLYPQTGTLTDVESNVFQKKFDTRKEALLVMDTLDEIGWGDRYDFDNQEKVMTLKGVEDKDLALLQRKVKIRTWSSRTIAVANTVTDFASDVADYALNGAVAPTIGAVSNAALTTGRVVGTAAVKASAMVLASTIRNGRQAVTEIKHSKEVNDAWAEVKGLGSDIADAIFGGSSSSSDSDWTRAAI